MKQGLQLRLSQHLALTPQLQQSIRLLQLSTLELNAEIDQTLLENPLLERDEPEFASPNFQNAGDREDSFQHGGEPQESGATSDNPDTESRTDSRSDANEAENWGSDFSSASRQRDANDEDFDGSDTQSSTTSLREHLGNQLALTQLSERDRAMISFLVEALDDDGYLTQDLDELAAVLAEESDDPEIVEGLRDELSIALRHLQNLDPPGIGARNAQECLALQLKELPESPERNLATAIVSGHLDLLAARDFSRLNKLLGCGDDALRAAQHLICSLNPRPGARFSPIDTRYVIPDVTVRKIGGAWTVALNNEAMPRLRINRLYASILQNQRGSAGGLTTQLQEAKWLIKNIQQRFDTIQRVSQAIVDRQRAFFDHGEVAMRPLTLREIAETVELHESTISRVTTQKYLASPRGVFELKYFFGSHVATDSGGAASSTAIRALIKQLVSNEDGKKPLSDARIAEILGEQGIVVARRTVAKYRDLLSIPPVALRKTL